MILSYQSIKKRCLEEGMIIPFHERTVAHGMSFGCGPASYDIRIAETHWLSVGGKILLFSSLETVDMPLDLIATIKNKSTWARKGLTIENNLIDPGFRGHITLQLANNGLQGIKLMAGMPIAQLIFEPLDQPTELAYAGKYQDQKAGAVKAILEKV